MSDSPRPLLASPLLDFDPATLPWVDRADFEESLETRLARGDLSSDDATLLRAWHRDGYVVLEKAIEPELLDAVWADFERALSDRPQCLVEIEGLGWTWLRRHSPRRDG